MAPSPEASSRPPEKPADAPPSGAALSDKARMKLEKQLQTQENKLQKLLAKSGEIESIEALRKVIEKETLFEPALACLKKQAQIAQESKGAIDPKSFVEKAERLEALENRFIKNLANGNGSAVAAGELYKKFTDALSPTKPAEQAVVLAEERARTRILLDESPAKSGEETVRPQTGADAAPTPEKAGTERRTARTKRQAPPKPLSSPPADVSDLEQALETYKETGKMPPEPARPTSRLPTPPPRPTGGAAEQGARPSSAVETEKEKDAVALLHRVLTDVARVPAGETIPRRMPDGKVVSVSGKDMAAELQKVIKTYQTLEFPKKTLTEQREIVLRDIEDTTSHPRLRADLERAFVAKGWLPTAETAPLPPPKPAAERVPPLPAVLPKPPSETVPPSVILARTVETAPLPPKDAPATLAGNPPPKESAPATPVSTPMPAAEKTEVPPKPPERAEMSPVAEKTKTQNPLAEFMRLRRAVTSTLTPERIAPAREVPPTPPKAAVPEAVKSASVPSTPPKVSPLAEFMKPRSGTKMESTPIPPNPSVPSRTEAVPPKPPEATTLSVPKPPEAVSLPKPAEVPPAPSRGGGERSDLSPDSRSGLERPTGKVLEGKTEKLSTAEKIGDETDGFTLKQTRGLKIGDEVMPTKDINIEWKGLKKIIGFSEDYSDTIFAVFSRPKEGAADNFNVALLRKEKSGEKAAFTFEKLATLSKEDLAKIAAAVPDDTVWAVALQGMTTSALEKAVQAALPPERVDNFALEGLTLPIQPKDKIEKAQKEIEAKAREVLAAKTDKEA